MSVFVPNSDIFKISLCSSTAATLLVPLMQKTINAVLIHYIFKATVILNNIIFNLSLSEFVGN